MGIVERYLLQLNTQKQRFRRSIILLSVLSLLVMLVVSWNLRQTGIALANDSYCGIEEHMHTEECGSEKVLICGFDTEDPAELPTQTPTEIPTETPAELSTDVPEEIPTDVPAETPTGETGEETGNVIVEDPVEVVGVTTSNDAPESPSGTPEGETSEAADAEHVHTDACYADVWLCGMEEHIHLVSCYSDVTADVETASVWVATLPEITGNWAKDLVRVAQSQLGNVESERNYLLADDGVTRNGITRYGQWYGNPHGDWSGMFVLFCLNYAEVPQTAVPWSPGVSNLMRMAQDADILRQPDADAFPAGSLLFVDTDGNGKADRVMIVTDSGEETVTAICGDWENAVQEVTLFTNDGRIMGYINVRYLQAPSESAEETEEPDETEEESDKPGIYLDVEFPEEESVFRLVAQIANIEEDMFTWQWQVSEDGNDPWTDIDGATELTCELEATEENLNRYYRLQGRRIAEQRVSTFAIRYDSAEVTEDEDTITSGAISPFSIGKNNSNVYTIDVYAMPVDRDNNRITDTGFGLTQLGSIRVENTTKILVESSFDDDLGEYRSAYFGTTGRNGQISLSVDDIQSVWRTQGGYSWWPTYYLSYQQTNGTTNNQWLSNADNSMSLYLRYVPQYTVTFTSEGIDPLTERVDYKGTPTLEEPGTWTREGYKLLGWIIDGNEQTVYTYEELMQRPVTKTVTYTAKWQRYLTVSFDTGEYEDQLYPIEPVVISPGESIGQLPMPLWLDNNVAMAFDGWYLDEEFTQQVTADTRFNADTVLHAKWVPKEEGYYVYFMDFQRDAPEPLVLATYSVAEGRTVFPYTPGNEPEGKQWDGKWYLDSACTMEYDFSNPVSSMTDYLTGASGKDLYLYPGMQDVYRAIFVTYGTRVDPVTVPYGETINLDQYRPERLGYTFAGWTLKDGTPVSGAYALNENTTFYATWEPSYVRFEAVLRIENANDTDMTIAETLGSWYAIAGSQIRVKSSYSGTGTSRKGTHTVVCVLDGKEYPVYTDASCTQQATLSDVYAKYFVYNNTGTNWTDAVNWDDVYTGGQVPYDTKPVSGSGDTIVHFDYMRVRTDVRFVFDSSSNKNYIDVYKLYQEGILTGSVTYTGTVPTTTGQNVSATGTSGTGMNWTYTASRDGDNVYTLLNVKYGQRIYEDYPVGNSWLTVAKNNFYAWTCNGTNFASRRQDLSDAFFKSTGRGAQAYDLEGNFSNQNKTALMYAIECLPGETADFTINGVGYKVRTELCEIASGTNYSAKELLGCGAGTNARGSGNYGSSDLRQSSNTSVGGTKVYTLFKNYESYYTKFGIDSISEISYANIFYYKRLRMEIQFNFAYDSDGDGSSELVSYDDILYETNLDQYKYGMAGYERHPLLEREGYEFQGWMDPNGGLMEDEDWESIAATGDSEHNTMVFVAKWEKISNNIVEYYEDLSATEPFDSHFFDDGEPVEFPTMAAYPDGWVWQEYGEGPYQRFDWDVPMYGEYGVPEIRTIQGEEREVNVIRIYGTWDESHTKVVYDPNPAQGGIIGTAPTDSNSYTIWSSEVPVAGRGETANANEDMVFVGWLLDRNGVVYQPGDHVQVRWPRTMIFTAQWAKQEEVVYLKYDPNGGDPVDLYPDNKGFPYKKNASAAVWDNTGEEGAAWFTRAGYKFVGWNTEPDGSGTSYPAGSAIKLTEPETTLYAQWEKSIYTMSLTKIDSDSKTSLPDAKFALHHPDGTVQELTTSADGTITFENLEIDTLYKLVEEKAPDGYAIVTKEIFFRVQSVGNTVNLVFCNAAGNVISAPPKGVTGTYATDTRMLTLQVENLRGYELPSTGGIGDLLYILIGLILISAPFVYGFSLRRKYGRRLFV